MNVLWHPPRDIVNILQNAKWQPQACLTHYRLSPQWRDWILERNSMTKRLRIAAAVRFDVKLVTQAWQKPLLSEARLLNLQPGALTLVREVQLLCDNEVWLLGRTIIPCQSYSGKVRRLHFLNDKPLGSFLFSDPHLKRSEFEIAKIKYDHETLWARRSILTVFNKPILLTEVFLPVVK